MKSPTPSRRSGFSNSCRSERQGIEPGKLADLITVAMRQPHLAPTHLPVHTLMLYGNAADVADVMVEGRWVMRGRQVLTVDEAEVLRDAAEESSAAIRRAGLETRL